MNEATALLRAIARWERSTGTSASDLGAMVLNHPGFVPLLRKRGTLKETTDQLIRSFMKHFPDAPALPVSLRDALKREARAASPWRPERHAHIMQRLQPSPNAMGGGQAAHIRTGHPGSQDRRPGPADIRHRPDRDGPRMLAR